MGVNSFEFLLSPFEFLFEVDYKKYHNDLILPEKINFDYDKISFMDKIKDFFEKNGLMINWKEFEKLDQAQQINTLSMIAPFQTRKSKNC